MDSTLKAYIIAHYDSLAVGKRRKALRIMKFEEDRTLRAFSLALPFWAMEASIEAGAPVHEDLGNDPKNTLAALREHFEAELAEIV